MRLSRFSKSALQARAFVLLRRVLSQPTRNRLKQRLAYYRMRLAPLYRARYGTVDDARELIDQLADRIPPDTEIIMVHCSYNDLLPTYTGGLAALLNALLELTEPGRTLVMPAFFLGEDDPVAHYEGQPIFDVRRHPSQMGLLSEAFRRRRSVKRSLHPTHSVCAEGPLADFITRDHHLASTTFGEGTPFAIMATKPTAIIGLGTLYFRCLTQFHVPEDLLGEQFPLPIFAGRLPVQLRDGDGEMHDYNLQIRKRLPHRLELMEPLLTSEVLNQWWYKGIPLFVASASGVTQTLVDAARRGETVYEDLPIGSVDVESSRLKRRRLRATC